MGGTAPVSPAASLTRHGEDPYQPVNAAVPQQGHLHCASPALLLLPLGLAGSPDAGSKDHQVEDRHRDDGWDVDGHGGEDRLLTAAG